MKLRLFVTSLLLTLAASFSTSISAQSPDQVAAIEAAIEEMNKTGDGMFFAKWVAPDIVIETKLPQAGAKEIQQMLDDPTLAPVMHSAMLKSIMADSDVVTAFVMMKALGVKGVKMDIMDILGDHCIIPFSIDEIISAAKE